MLVSRAVLTCLALAVVLTGCGERAGEPAASAGGSSVAASLSASPSTLGITDMTCADWIDAPVPEQMNALGYAYLIVGLAEPSPPPASDPEMLDRAFTYVAGSCVLDDAPEVTMLGTVLRQARAQGVLP